MRLEDLEVFRAVHDTGSFQRAAHRVGLSQSAVTKVVRRLEDEFGLQLVERGVRTAALTPAGRTLYARALELGGLVNSTRSDMAGEAAALRGSIRLGVVPALLNSVATPVLADVLAAPATPRPGVEPQIAVRLGLPPPPNSHEIHAFPASRAGDAAVHGAPWRIASASEALVIDIDSQLLTIASDAFESGLSREQSACAERDSEGPDRR